MLPVLLFAPHIVAFFNAKEEVVHWGSLLLYWHTPFFVFNGFNQIYCSALRGAGNTRVPMIIILSCFVGFRQLYLFVMSMICNQFIPITLAYPAGWLLCSLLSFIYYHRTSLDRSRLIED